MVSLNIKIETVKHTIKENKKNENNTFKLNLTDDNVVELMYNEPKTGTNNYGDWYLYGVKKMV